MEKISKQGEQKLVMSMKKSTKKLLMSLSIILIFGLSSIAFVATGLLGNSGGNTQGQQIEQLTSPVVEGNVDPAVETAYIQHGFTWIKYYYKIQDPSFLSFLEGLQQSFTTNNQVQVIIQKINSSYANEASYIIVESQYGQDSFVPDNNRTISALCKLLYVTPVECAVRNLNLTK